MGKFIIFEGVDYSGKGSQISFLYEYLTQQGYSVALGREPGGSEISESIRQILLDNKHTSMNSYCELFLYMAARFQFFEEVVSKVVAETDYYILDRSGYSTDAYQGAGRGLDTKFITEYNKRAYAFCHPDVCLILNISFEEMQKRRPERLLQSDRMDNQKDEFYKKVIQRYRQMPEVYPECVLVNAEQSIEKVSEEILDILVEKNILM